MPTGFYERTYIRTPQQRFEEKFIPDPNSGCWLWIGSIDRIGYGQFKFGRQYAPNEKAHRTAWKIYRGDIPHGMHVLHSCDVRCCVNPDHLRLGTHQDNMRDKMTRGRHRSVTGIEHHSAKVSDAQVIEMRRKAAVGVGQRALAREYGLAKTTVKAIISRQTWRHVNG